MFAAQLFITSLFFFVLSVVLIKLLFKLEENPFVMTKEGERFKTPPFLHVILAFAFIVSVIGMILAFPIWVWSWG